MPDEPLIVLVIQRYNPDWQPPADTGKEWVPCRCAFHLDETKSAAVSYEHNAFRCLGCPAKGNAITLIKQQEGVSFGAAERIASSISTGGDYQVPPSPPRNPGRRVFDSEATPPHERRSAEVPSRVRGRTPPWT